MVSHREDPLVRTRAGTVRGIWRGESARFLGIPFAEPPVGDLRFAAPRPVRSWDGIRDARAYGPTPQRAKLAEVTMIPEPTIPGDAILNVNVFTPRPAVPADGTDGLPVLVWLHGGGYTAGSPASPWYDGAAFTRDGIVVVSLSYRLGFDGFGLMEGAPANRGVLDWVLGLEWVRENIRAFGGDPDRVTVAGQSAGGGAALTLLTLPRAQGLMHGVFAISGAPADIPLERAREVGAEVAETLGVPPTREGFASIDEADLFAVQGAPLAGIPGTGPERLRALADFSVDGLRYGPVIDGELVIASVPDALAAGAASGIPLVAGATRDEFTGSLIPIADYLNSQSPHALLAAMGVAPERVSDVLAGIGSASPIEVAGRVLADNLFRTPLLQILAARGDSPTWLYDFAWRSPVSGFAQHCLDLPFFFDNLAEQNVARVAGSAPPQELADQMHRALVHLVVDGDPGWERADPRGVRVRTFDVVEAGGDGYASARATL
jgi:para-nitrobenzyl esterase